MTWPLQVGSISSQSKAILKSLKKYGDLSCSLEAYLEDELGGKIWKLLYGDADIIQSLYLAALFLYANKSKIFVYKNNAKLIIIAIKFLSLMMCLENLV